MSLKVALTNQTKYELLLQISQKVRNTLDLDEILNLLLDTLQTTIEYDAAGIFVLNTEEYIPHELPAQVLIAGIARRGFDPHPDEADRMLMLGEGNQPHNLNLNPSPNQAKLTHRGPQRGHSG